MARLDVGGVYINPTAGAPNPATITGSPPQWSDDSDATYATTCLSHYGGSILGDRLRADIDTLADPASVTGITLHIRVKVWNTAAGTGSTFMPILKDSAGNDYAYFGEAYAGMDAPTTDAVYDLSTNTVLLGSGGTPEDGVAGAANLMAAGAMIQVDRYGTTYTGAEKHHFIEIYELWFEIAGLSAPQPPLYTAPRRLTQRGDGAFGGAPRLTGTRSTQASNRLLGGYL